MFKLTFYCPGCQHKITVVMDSMTDDTGKEYEELTIDCPICHEYNLEAIQKEN